MPFLACRTDGYIACKEHEDILRSAWEEDQANAAERAQAKRENRIYGNWKKLIRGVLALQRVRSKYKDQEVKFCFGISCIDGCLIRQA